MSEENDNVGYKRPPRAHQFKPKTSGNPSGRPRGAKNRKTILRDIARQTHRVKIDGKMQERTTAELLILKLQRLALDGSLKAKRLLDTYREKLAPQLPEGGGGYFAFPAELTMEEFERMAEAHQARAAHDMAQFAKEMASTPP